MKKAVLALGVVLVVGAGIFFAVRANRSAEESRPGLANAKGGAETKKKPDAGASSRVTPPLPAEAAKKNALTAEEKAARITKIMKDYEEIMTKAAADFGAAPASFPGGFNAYLRQLALIDREKWKDFREFLTEREVEDLQFRDHHAGKLVVQWLGDSAATDEQKRAVLRAQRAYDDKFALIYDLSPSAMLTRETERQQLQEQILGTIGPDLFAAWVRSEGDDFGNMVNYAKANGIRPEAALDAWRLKNEFVRRRLEIKAQLGDGPQAVGQQVALIEETRAKVGAVLGGAALATPQASGLTWLK